jgi:hypothetical protein
VTGKTKFRWKDGSLGVYLNACAQALASIDVALGFVVAVLDSPESMDSICSCKSSTLQIVEA